MKIDWKTRPLNEVCQIRPPKSEAREKIENNQFVSFLPMEDLGIHRKFSFAIKEKSFEQVVSGYTYFANEDVLLAKITPCFENGKLGIAKQLKNGVGFGSSEYIVFRANPVLSNEYLYYFLSTIDFRNENIKRMRGAVGHKRVDKNFIESYPIPIPPLPEQQRIVEILDQTFAAIDQAIANTVKNLQNAQELFDSYLEKIFRFQINNSSYKKLKDVCRIVGGGTPAKNNQSYYEGSIPWATVRDMRGDLIDDTEFSITEEAVKNSSTNIIPKNNVIIATRVGLGKVSIIKKHTAINQDLKGIIPLNNNLNEIFLFYWFKSLSKEIISNGTGATVQGVKLDYINNLKIPLYSLPKQLEIVQNLEKFSKNVQKLKINYKQKLTNLHELKQSILQKAFNGELT